MMNPKYVLVNMIEERLNITFTNEQLAYIFNEDADLLMTAPRRYGKNLITAVKIVLQLLLNDNYRIEYYVFQEIQLEYYMNKLKICLQK